MIIPALDLIDGKVVRLFQGDFAQVTHYAIDPLKQFSLYQEKGAQWLHLVDLDGAKNHQNRQLLAIKNLIEKTQAKVQVGGGIRTEQDLAELLNIGASRVVIGSLAVEKPEQVKEWISKYGAERIILALDVNIDQADNAHVALSGWQHNSSLLIEDVLNNFQSVGIRHLLCTDISRDGTLSGSNKSLYQRLRQQYPELQIQASGGIGSLADIAELTSLNLAGIIVGRALLEGKFTLKEAMAALAKGVTSYAG